ncbi:uncharacterized protein METZ01_LOCUS34281 [marine metagenome]|uniref:Uncharacterized protein n=1 Tax=marine metagenome TaxID=408172 RepID=A0A381QUG2_9ZZZZ
MNNLLLDEDNKKLFLQTHPEFVDNQKFDLFNKRIQILASQTDELINKVKNNGFKEDLGEIDPMKWYSFISNAIVYIENIKGLSNGEEKMELLLGFISVIIMNLIPVSEPIKLLLINQIHEIIPEIVDGLIFVSKNLHTFSLNVFKKLKSKCSCLS